MHHQDRNAHAHGFTYHRPARHITRPVASDIRRWIPRMIGASTVVAVVTLGYALVGIALAVA